MMKILSRCKDQTERIVAKAVSKMFNTFPTIISENLSYGIVESDMAYEY